jgi:hypothetical protein
MLDISYSEAVYHMKRSKLNTSIFIGTEMSRGLTSVAVTAIIALVIGMYMLANMVGYCLASLIMHQSI